MGEASRRHRHRHGRQPGEDRDRQRPWLRPFILYRVTDVAKRVRELTGGNGVPVVYDGVGKDTFPASLDCLAPLGMIVSFGNASGPVPPFDPLILGQGLPLFHPPDADALHRHARRTAGDGPANCSRSCLRGAVKVEVNQTYRCSTPPMPIATSRAARPRDRASSFRDLAGGDRSVCWQRRQAAGFEHLRCAPRMACRQGIVLGIVSGTAVPAALKIKTEEWRTRSVAAGVTPFSERELDPAQSTCYGHCADTRGCGSDSPLRLLRSTSR